jgi:hypothetical protein
MRLSKDKTALTVNPSLTLAGIPPETFSYRLGNRSALEWVIDQYEVSEDKRSGIRSDPNHPDDPEYIVRLVGQVVRVSIETVRIVSALPAKFSPQRREGEHAHRNRGTSPASILLSAGWDDIIAGVRLSIRGEDHAFAISGNESVSGTG